MKLASLKFALAAMITLGIIYVVCAAVVAIAPDFALSLFGWLVHLVNVDQFMMEITAGSVLIGLVQILLYTFVAAWLFAMLYDRFVGSV